MLKQGAVGTINGYNHGHEPKLGYNTYNYAYKLYKLFIIIYIYMNTVCMCIYIYPLSSLELPTVIPYTFSVQTCFWASPAILRLFFAGLMAPDLVHVLQQIRKTCAAGDISNV